MSRGGWPAVFLALAASGVPSSWARAQTPVPQAPVPAPPRTGDPARLERAVRDLMSRGGIPGLGVALLRDGAVAWIGQFGLADADRGAPVTADTVFEAASLGKPVFAYAVMRLVERGEFDLDRPLNVVLPLPDLRNDPRARMVTARRVLCHTAGFPNWRRGGQLALEFDPGDRFSYSGEGYLYLQKVIEAVTGLDVNEFVGREVFQPLGMTASSYVWRDSYEAAAAVGHDYLQRPTPKARPARANVAATLHTTVGDYARFLAETLRPRLTRPATIEQMLRPEIEVDKNKDVLWGLGWGLERASGRSYLWHWGDNGTFQGFAIGCRETGEGLVLLTDGENGLSIAEPIVAEAVGGPHPLFGWLDVDSYDSPARTIRGRLVQSGQAAGEQGVLRAFGELGKTYPRAAFTEKLLNRTGYELLTKKQVPAAIAVFEQNARLYRKSWNVYDSLGEAYAAGGDLRLAIANYERSLKLNPSNENAKAALRELKEAGRR